LTKIKHYFFEFFTKTWIVFFKNLAGYKRCGKPKDKAWKLQKTNSKKITNRFFIKESKSTAKIENKRYFAIQGTINYQLTDNFVV
jgi:hypothetical protein